jgi:hypothetical protein
MEDARMTLDERVQFAIRFARANLAHYRAGDWMNLRDDLERFLGVKVNQTELVADMAFTTAIPCEDIDRLPEQKLAALQKDVSRVLQSFAGGSTDWVPINLQYGPRRIRLNSVKDEAVIVSATGAVRDCVLEILLHILRGNPTASVEICPECRTIFYCTGKMKFCGRTCTNRAMMKAKRKRDQEAADAAKKRAKARKAGK